MTTARVLAGFGDLPDDVWRELLAGSPTRTVFLTRTWLQAWWETLGHGDLLLVAAERDGRVVALAPLYADGGTVAFLGEDSSDYLDVLGESTALNALLATAAEATPGFTGFRLAHLPERSATTAELAGCSPREERALPAPTLARSAIPEAVRKKSLVRHENWFRRNGTLAAVEARDDLERFFDQHVERCTAAPYDSLFEDERHRSFYRRIAADSPEWLRVTRVDWNERPLAYHFGMCFDGSYLWYKPSFDLELAARSPGEVLLRQLLLAAYDEGAHTFDFGIGDEAFKYRFATDVPVVRTWRLEP